MSTKQLEQLAQLLIKLAGIMVWAMQKGATAESVRENGQIAWNKVKDGQ